MRKAENPDPAILSAPRQQRIGRRTEASVEDEDELIPPRDCAHGGSERVMDGGEIVGTPDHRDDQGDRLVR